MTLYHGDCLEVMRTMPDCSVDSVVTDPPYGLSFMGKRWDYDVPSVDIWRECLRVLKPGGHLLAFAGTRTQHRMAVNIEDAGFEIRDMIAWVYGSGFPKSMDISKAIDKVAPRRGQFDAFAEHFKERLKASGKKQKEVAELFPSKTNGLTGCVWNWANGTKVPTKKQFEILKPLLGLSNQFDELIDRVEAEREVVGQKTSGIKNAKEQGRYTIGASKAVVVDITTPATPEAQQWEGWGTSLKPALEPLTVARKPLQAKTVAQNVLEHGTGGINIDGCRVTCDPADFGDPARFQTARKGNDSWDRQDKGMFDAGRPGGWTNGVPSGRWPANLIHDGSDEVVELFGPAARFFQQCKGGYAEVWQDLNLPPEAANTADSSSSQQRAAAVSALALAVSSVLPGVTQLSVQMAPSTTAMGSELKLIAESVTQAILSIAPRFWHESQPARLSLTNSPVSVVVQRELTGITTITASHWKSDGSADPATFVITPMNLEHGERDYAARFRYCAKASKADREDGNVHPTVKPVELMAYLCRLVTPPGGIVLDPFMGSGSTIKAALSEGFRAIGIERDPSYYAIAERRLNSAQLGLPMELEP